MTPKRTYLTLLLFSIFIFTASAVVARPFQANSNLDTSFTYQGHLEDAGDSANGDFDLRFELYDAETGGNQVGTTQVVEDLRISNGLFTVQLNFGDIFDGSPLFMEIAVRPGDSLDAFTVLSPRQTLTATPYANFASRSVWSGLEGVPTDLADGDDDTTYSAGFGLGLNGNQFNVDTTDVQARVTGACTVGQTIQVINADGTVVCESSLDPALSARQDFAHNIVDQSGEVGNYPAITIGIDGLPIIAHYASDDVDLKVSHCNDPACNSATWTLVDTDGGVSPSITIGVDGLPLISYAAFDGGIATTFNVAHCHDLFCNSADIFVIDDIGNHWDSSITIGVDGLGLISYQDWTNNLLQVAHCDDVVCSQATITTLDGPFGNGANFISIAIGVDGLGLISYSDIGLDDLKVAHCDDTICSGATVTTLDSTGDVGSGSSLTIGADGRGIISHLDQLGEWLKVSHCNNLICDSAATSNVSYIGDVRSFNETSIAIGNDGLPLIAHISSSTAKIRIARCNTLDCQGSVVVSILPMQGLQLTMVIGVDGLPLIAFQHVYQERLEIVRTVFGRGSSYR